MGQKKAQAIYFRSGFYVGYQRRDSQNTLRSTRGDIERIASERHTLTNVLFDDTLAPTPELKENDITLMLRRISGFAVNPERPTMEGSIMH